MNLEIKNMVCPRCISSIKGILTDLGIEFKSLSLGLVELSETPEKKLFIELQKKIHEAGFEILESNDVKMINKIKVYLIEKIHHKLHSSPYKLSDELSTLIGKEYSTISKTFKKVENKTIEHFILFQKIEKVKALLSYNEKTLSEIAFDMNYSSTAHLSAQFKKITGMTPSVYKAKKVNHRKPLDHI